MARGSLIAIHALTKGYAQASPYYDGKHEQAVNVDLLHAHKGLEPYRHEYMSHSQKDPGIPPTDAEMALIRRIKKEFRLQ